MDNGQALPLHNVHVVNFDERVKRDARPPWPQRIWTVIHFLHSKLTKTNTGTPSDGLGKGPAGSRGTSVEGSLYGKTPASLYAASVNNPEYRHYVEHHDEESDWSVDEVVVSGEEDNQSVPPISDPVYYPDYPHASDSMRMRLRWAPLFWQAYYAVIAFFHPTFPDKDAEIRYQKEQWHNNKMAAGYFSIYLVINWALYLWLNHSVTLYEYITFYGVFTLFTLPVPVMVAINLNNKAPFIFQTWFCIATWYCALTEVIQIKECGFYTPEKNCHGKDFLAMYYYATGFPVIALFICARRSYMAFFQVVFFILLNTMIIPDQTIYARNVVGYWLSYRMEKARRHLHQLNAQLKQAYFQLESSKQAEAQLSESRSLFAAYIFHEVRVPLNTAMLSFDSLQASGTLKKETVKTQTFEVHALEVSLKQMQQVLNDVLDLQKMDTGLFEFKPRPFPFHRTLSHIFSHLNVAAAAKGIPLAVKFDANIDEVRLRPNSPTPDEGLWVIGDEIRLRQIITNLGSNAIKFTGEGGAVTIVTKLVQTPADRHMREEEDERLAMDAREREIVEGRVREKEERDREERDREERDREKEGGCLDPEKDLEKEKDPGHVTVEMGKMGEEERRTEDATSTDGKSSTGSPQSVSMRMFKFRVEVHDQGPGLTPGEFRKLRKFQPFVQTAIGKNSGKGSGLGLPIVRQLVALSGGKMGVISRKGEGAIFWFELSFPVATQGEVRAAKAMMSTIPPPPSIQTPSSPASLGTPNSPFAKPQAPFAFTSMASDTTVSTAFMQPFLPTPGSEATESTLAGSPGPLSGKRTSVLDMAGAALAETPGEEGEFRLDSGEKARMPMPQPLQRPVSRTPPPSLSPTVPRSPLDSMADHKGPPPAPLSNATNTTSSMLQVPKPPRHAPSMTPSVPSVANGPIPSEEPLEVLVVDDEPLTGKIMARLLQSMGAKVTTATDGQQCLDILLGPPERRFDLVCLDNSMPVMTGLEAVGKLRGAGRLDFVVGCTGNALVTDQGEYKDAGADMILTKPLTRDRLMDLVNIARYRRKHNITGRYSAHAAL
ncbi:histidine kinase [Schizophyllum commune]